MQRKTEARSHNHCCRGRAVSITDSECVFVAFVFQCAMRMRHTILQSVACLVIPYFFLLPHKGQDFQKKLLNVKSVLIFLCDF